MRLIVFVVAGAVACARCLAAPLITLTLQQQNGDLLRAGAHDAALSAPNTEVTRDLPPSQLPMSVISDARDGLSDTNLQYSFADTGLHLALSEQRSSAQNSLAEARGQMTFIANYDLHYQASGAYSVTSGQVQQIQQTMSLGDLSGGTGFNSNNTDVNGGPGSFTVGGNQGSTVGQTTGALEGTLFAGRTYRLFYYAETVAPYSSDGGDSATGFYDLSLSLRGDFNNDRSVGFDDLVTLAANYGRHADYAHGDIDGSGTVDFEDLVILARNYGLSVPVPMTPVPVPEPVISLCILIIAVVVRR